MMLLPAVQRFVVSAWAASKTDSNDESSTKELLSMFGGTNWKEWVEGHSGSGARVNYKELERLLDRSKVPVAGTGLA